MNPITAFALFALLVAACAVGYFIVHISRARSSGLD
jgi:hypothetical protein